MKKSLLHTISILPRKLIFVLSFLFIIHSSLFITHCSAQWYKQQIPVNKPVTGIKFLDTLNGWASTGNLQNPTPQDTGFIIHTTNGGAIWYIQSYKIAVQFSAFAMVNNLTGYASGDSIDNIAGTAKLFKTTNGGINWFNVPIAYNMFVSRLFFLSPDTGWETDNSASSPEARLTTDGGYTWLQRVSGMTDYPTRDVYFLNYNTGFCVSGGQIYKTTNAGLNWNFVYDNVSGIYSVLFVNESIGWIGIFNKQIKYTTNGGSSWNNQILPPMAGTSVYSLALISDSILYAGQVYDFIFRTNNRGLNWGYQTDTSNSVYMSIIDSLHGWTGDLGISHTSNGGGTIIYVGIINISDEIPQQYKLFQNFPNPFNQVKIYDVSGKEMTLWKSNEQLSAGTHEIKFDAGALASGVYFYRLAVTDLNGKEVFKETKKMILLK